MVASTPSEMLRIGVPCLPVTLTFNDPTNLSLTPIKKRALVAGLKALEILTGSLPTPFPFKFGFQHS